MIVIGEGLLDLYIDLEMIKLGGVFHYAHVLESLKIRSAVLHISPDYMSAYLNKLQYQFVKFIKIGEINNSPNIITVGESKETGNQNYKNVLDDLKIINIYENNPLDINIENDDHLFILPGSYKIKELLKYINKFTGKLYIDAAYDITKEVFEDLNYQFEIIFISTSSMFFIKQFNGKIQDLKNWIIPKFAKVLIFKENRGGSRIFTENDVFNIPAHLTKISHSVGVGDCYNLAFISKLYDSNYTFAGKYASKIASIYSQCNQLDEFKLRINNLTPDDYLIEGVNLPWEEREKYSIYIAAPDFKNVDTSIIDSICTKLEYHNFKPVRPLKLFGEISSETSQIQKRQIIKKDINLIKSSKLILAILLYKDEGTLTEIGYAAALGKLVIIFDPFKLINNAFVENISSRIIHSIDDLINEIFILMKSNK